MCYAAETYPDKRAFGTRSVEKVITETKQITKMVDGKETTVDKEWKYFQLGPYEWISQSDLIFWCLTHWGRQAVTWDARGPGRGISSA